MKFVIVLAALIACALARPQETQILRQESDVRPDGYNWAYELSDGSRAEESGHLKAAGGEVDSISVTGSFSYIGDDGQTYSISYLADENGFQPEGAHIPVAPPA